MPKYVQIDNQGYISVVISPYDIPCPEGKQQIIVPDNTVTDGMMVDLATMQLVPIPVQEGNG